MEDASRGQRGGARDVPPDSDPVSPSAVDCRHGGQKRLGVRVVRTVEDDVGRAELLHPSEVQHGDPIGDVADDPEVVGDRGTRPASPSEGLDEEVQDRRLFRRMVDADVGSSTHELQVAGECACDRDALLQAA